MLSYYTKSTHDMRMISPSPAHPFIVRLKQVVLFATLFFAFLQMIPLSGTHLFSQIFQTSPFHNLFFDVLFSPLSLLVLNIRTLSLQLVFDLLILNFFLPPLVSFVYSFLDHRKFLFFLLASGAASSLFLHIASFLMKAPFLPTTLFAHAILSLLAFWASLNRKHTSTHFLVFPLRPVTLLTISLLAAGMPSFLDHDWIKLSSLLFSMAFGYASGLWMTHVFDDRRRGG